MAKIPRRPAPRTFFLNEHHELPPVEKSGGGRTPQYANIDWAHKGRRINASLERTMQSNARSTDPLRGRRYFMVAVPERVVQKKSKDKKKAPAGTIDESTDFASSQTRIFARLGLDLLEVTDDGSAVVHATPENLQRLLQRTESLDDMGIREQARWATIHEFADVPSELRVDSDWLSQVRQSQESADVVIELQPLLSRVEVEDVLRSLTDTISQFDACRLTGGGQDYSGRSWFRGRLSASALRRIARNYFSVQSLHSPLVSVAAAKKATQRRASGKTEVDQVTVRPPQKHLPVVACLDTGVPPEHSILREYRRGQFLAPTAAGRFLGRHGTHVASRIVFGDIDWPAIEAGPVGDCAFLDGQVSITDEEIDDKAVFDALEGIRGAFPDVRVFNMSFSHSRPYDMDPVLRREKNILSRDLDNFVFEHDIIVVASAGNAPSGVVPTPPYPDHLEDPNWRLCSWAAAFNSVVCGSYVGEVHARGIANHVGWPSPFTRVGPGLAGSPVPDFSAPGGDWETGYRWAPGLGVWSLAPDGHWEDISGTSLAAPILAREFAKTLHKLSEYCQPGSRAFGVTAKAFLRITAIPPTSDSRVDPLVRRTLGYGAADSERLTEPNSESAVMLWQGQINGAKDLLRIQVPIPQEWIANADTPRMRLVVCWDPPVNDAVTGVWACREVKVQFRPSPDITALRPRGRRILSSYPVIDRVYHLDNLPDGVTIDGDVWLLDLSYDEIADYYSGMEFTPLQRIGVAIELSDDGANPESPQSMIQNLAVASTMEHLSAVRAPIQQPVVVKSRIR
jgi:hypothetical protein